MKRSATPFTHVHTREDLMSIERLEQRLEDGYRMIEAQKVAGVDVTDLESFWIDLLHQYEGLCDALPMAA